MTDHDLLTIYTWSTVAIAIVAAAAGSLAWRQLVALRRSRDWESGRGLMDELRTPERINKTLPELYGVKRDLDHVGKHPLLSEFRLIISRLEWTGAMVKKGLLNIDVVMGLVGAMPLRVWYILGRYIEQENETREYGYHFMIMVRNTTRFYLEREPRKRWPRLSSKEHGSVDLIKEAIKAGVLSEKELRMSQWKRRFRVTWNWALKMSKDDWNLIGSGKSTG